MKLLSDFFKSTAVVVRYYLTVLSEDVNNLERIEVLRSQETTVETYLRILCNVKTKWDYFADINSLSQLPFTLDKIRGRGIQ